MQHFIYKENTIIFKQAYKGKTEQGHAFHILAQSCRKTITMTGTLMNGYVNSMYYLLYRLLPQAMKRG